MKKTQIALILSGLSCFIGMQNAGAQSPSFECSYNDVRGTKKLLSIIPYDIHPDFQFPTRVRKATPEVRGRVKEIYRLWGGKGQGYSIFDEESERFAFLTGEGNGALSEFLTGDKVTIQNTETIFKINFSVSFPTDNPFAVRKGEITIDKVSGQAAVIKTARLFPFAKTKTLLSFGATECKEYKPYSSTRVTAVLSQPSSIKDGNCTDCHEQLENPVKHAAAINGCTACHDPDHDVNTGHPYRLLKAPNKLCSMCHVGIQGHPIKGHPLSGPEDPVYPKRNFSCVSCHSPHSSKMPKLFRYEYSSNTPYKDGICSICHGSIFNNNPQPPAPPWSGYQQ